MDNDQLDKDFSPRLTSNPAIRNSRTRKKPGHRKASTTKASCEDNEVTSTTPDVETSEPKQFSPSSTDSSNLADKEDVPSPIENGVEAMSIEKNAEGNTDKMRALESHNVKEKIVICVDSFDDPDGSSFTFSNGKKYSTLTMIQRVFTLFLKHKNAINSKHEFALIELEGDSARWKCDFTNDIEQIITSLENINPNEEKCASFDLTTLFDVIVENAIPYNMPEMFRNSVPPFVVRVIVIYGRSQCIPEFSNGTNAFNFWSESSKNCVLDILYVHESADYKTNCKMIYEKLSCLETGASFSFQVVRSAVSFHNCMARLLAHPLQRGDSSHMAFHLEPVGLGRNGSS